MIELTGRFKEAYVIIWDSDRTVSWPRRRLLSSSSHPAVACTTQPIVLEVLVDLRCLIARGHEEMDISCADSDNMFWAALAGLDMVREG